MTLTDKDEAPEAMLEAEEDETATLADEDEAADGAALEPDDDDPGRGATPPLDGAAAPAQTRLVSTVAVY